MYNVWDEDHIVPFCKNYKNSFYPFKLRTCPLHTCFIRIARILNWILWTTIKQSSRYDFMCLSQMRTYRAVALKYFNFSACQIIVELTYIQYNVYWMPLSVSIIIICLYLERIIETVKLWLISLTQRWAAWTSERRIINSIELDKVLYLFHFRFGFIWYNRGKYSG